MELIYLLLGIALVGLVVFCILKIPMAEPFPLVIKIVALIVCILWLLRYVGPYLPAGL